MLGLSLSVCVKFEWLTLLLHEGRLEQGLKILRRLLKFVQNFCQQFIRDHPGSENELRNIKYCPILISWAKRNKYTPKRKHQN